MDLKYTIRMMGIPLDGPAWMFGDNQSVLTSSTLPHSSLNKRHNALSYHRVREAVAAKVMYFMKIQGTVNVSDIFTKFLPWTDFWPMVQPLLFWKGETLRAIDETLPISEIVALLLEDPSLLDGLRGVTSDIKDRMVNPNQDRPVVSEGVVGTESGTPGVNETEFGTQASIEDIRDVIYEAYEGIVGFHIPS
jgi:hypothetical protein